MSLSVYSAPNIVFMWNKRGENDSKGKLVVTRGTERSPAGLPEAFKDVVALNFRQALPRNGCSYLLWQEGWKPDTLPSFSGRFLLSAPLLSPRCSEMWSRGRRNDSVIKGQKLQPCAVFKPAARVKSNTTQINKQTSENRWQILQWGDMSWTKGNQSIWALNEFIIMSLQHQTTIEWFIFSPWLGKEPRHITFWMQARDTLYDLYMSCWKGNLWWTVLDRSALFMSSSCHAGPHTEHVTCMTLIMNIKHSGNLSDTSTRNENVAAL